MSESTELTPTEIAYAHTPEWWAARRTGIGASRAAAACGLSQYSTPLEVYAELLGNAPERKETKEQRLGLKVEPGIVEWYAEENGLDLVYPLPMYRHAEHVFMLATPDGKIDDSTGLEIKHTSRHLIKMVEEQGLDRVWPDYVCQAQQQMAVMGWQCVKLVAVYEKQVEEYEIVRNDRLIDGLINAEGELWDRVQRLDPPPADFSHPKALDFIRALHPDITPGIVRLTGATIQLQAEYVELSKQIREMEARQKEIRARQLAEIGSHEGGLLPDGRYLRRSITQRKEYTVPASERLDVRVCKVPERVEIIEPAGQLAITEGA